MIDIQLWMSAIDTNSIPHLYFNSITQEMDFVKMEITDFGYTRVRENNRLSNIGMLFRDKNQNYPRSTVPLHAFQLCID